MSGQDRVQSPICVPATYAVGTARGRGRVGDFSAEGLFVESPMLPAQGERVVVTFRDPGGRVISVHGTVRWNTSHLAREDFRSCGFGVRLSAFGEDYVDFVDKMRRAIEKSGGSSG